MVYCFPADIATLDENLARTISVFLFVFGFIQISKVPLSIDISYVHFNHIDYVVKNQGELHLLWAQGLFVPFTISEYENA